MKTLIVTLALFSQAAFAFELAGKWVNTADGTVLNFMRIGQSYNEHTTTQYNYPGGLPAYTISQSVMVVFDSENTLKGSVDFFDSRGCSFRGYPIIIEFQDTGTANALMTVPRYQISGCRVLENVNIPVELKRL